MRQAWSKVRSRTRNRCRCPSSLNNADRARQFQRVSYLAVDAAELTAVRLRLRLKSAAYVPAPVIPSRIRISPGLAGLILGKLVG